MSEILIEQFRKQLLDELEPLFFEELEKVGHSSFMASRIREAEIELSAKLKDDQILEWFERDIISDLEDRYDCSIEYSQYNDYQVTHNLWRVCIDDGEVYKPQDRDYKFVGYLDDFQDERFSFLQVDYDESHLRHLFLLDDEEFGYYIVEVSDGCYKRVLATTGIHLSSPVYEYQLEDVELC